MSDADDGFDREAERRKLEEKYGDEAEQRKSTQRMSELLLKGATMTNKHCDNCGDPLFRQDGQVFCPSCSATANGGADAEAGQAAAQADATQTEQTEQTDQTATDAPQPGQNATETAQQAAASDRGNTERTSPPEAGRRPVDRQQSASSNQSQETARQQPQEGARQQPQETARQQPRPQSQRQTTTQQPTDTVQSGGDLAAARESLVAAISEQARLGAATDDPRAAADHFAAAREAAETLAALRR